MASGQLGIFANGYWGHPEYKLLEQFNPETVPCRVRVEIAGQSAEREVEDAPRNCDNAGGGPAEFRLEKAEWESEKSRLRVEGDRARAGETVTVFTARTDERLGTTRVEGDGDWRFEQFNPETVPCRVRVEIAGQLAEREVEDAPRNCDEQSDGDTLSGVQVEAEWEDDRSRLKVKGEDFPPGPVEIFNADTDELLGEARDRGEGEWRFNVTLDPSAVLCSVRVELNGKSLTVPVSGAPDDCR